MLGSVTGAKTNRRRDKRRLKASLDFALLGLIAEQRAISGYDLLKIFNLSMVHFWHAHHAQIYSTLDRLEGQGLIRGRELVQHGKPNKRLYSITPAGRASLLEWLESSYEELRHKDAPLLRCRFLGHLDADEARAKFEEERSAHQEVLERYKGLERKFFPAERRYPNADMMFSYFTLRRGILLMEDSIRWCDWALAEIDRNRDLLARGKSDAVEGRALKRRAG